MSDNSNLKQNNTDHYIFADPFRTKDLIWDAYAGYIQNYSIYVMYKRNFKRENRIAKSGLLRYADDFYHEIRSFLPKFQSLNEKEVEKLHLIFNSLEISLEFEDMLFLRNFFENFMVESGLKSITKEKDNRPDYIKNFG